MSAFDVPVKMPSTASPDNSGTADTTAPAADASAPAPPVANPDTNEESSAATMPDLSLVACGSGGAGASGTDDGATTPVCGDSPNRYPSPLPNTPIRLSMVILFPQPGQVNDEITRLADAVLIKRDRFSRD